jgi:multiple sugar transport system substrate-binding protein
MNIMKKRRFWLLTMMVVLGLILASCQPADDGGGTDGGGEGETGGGGETTDETITLTVWDFGGSDFSWMPEIAIPEFEGKHPNIKIEHVGVLEDDFGLKIETAIAAGEIPDMIVFAPTRVVAAGHVLPLDDFMARDGISRDDYGPLFHSWNVFTGGKIDDKVVSLPVDGNIWAMVVNLDLIAEAGLPELGVDSYITFDDWLEYARAIDNGADNLEDRVWGSAMMHPVFNSMNNYMAETFVLGADGRTCEGNANNAEWVHAWEALTTAYLEDVTTETAGALLQDVDDDMFAAGKLGMSYGTLGDALFARDNGVNVALTGQPIVTAGWSGNVGGWNTSYSIMSATEHPNEAWEFLKFLSTEAQLNIPFAADMLVTDQAGLNGLPAYLPLLEQGQFAEKIASDPLFAAAVELMTHVVPPPFTPDIWTSVDGFWGIFDLVEGEGLSVQDAVAQVTVECQDITDQLWETFDSIGQ